MKHSHYHKAVGHLQTVDIYRVLQMFDVTGIAVAREVDGDGL